MVKASGFRRHIHLLYVPTLDCNLGCRYCYLGEQTARGMRAKDAARAVATLEQALADFLKAGVLPFNISLHGGEATILPRKTLVALFNLIRKHYLDHFDALTALGYRKSAPHLKTNLFNFPQLYSLFDRHKVSISASVDLPLALHGKYRTTRAGGSWLSRTLENLRLLARYPHAKKISATLYGEHLRDVPALIHDIWFIHRELGFDMNQLNFMFGFDSSFNREKLLARGEQPLRPVTDAEQLGFYNALKAAFSGTELEEGLLRNWFDEFKPSYCTNAFNCGERFYLLQSDGHVYSCVRGQGLEAFHYGNIFTDGVAEILNAGRRKISLIHQQSGFDQDCGECAHLSICHTGCPVVKQHHGLAKSYSCRLQKAIYEDHPLSYPPTSNPRERQAQVQEYLLGMHPAKAHEQIALAPAPRPAGMIFPKDWNEEKNTLAKLIENDPILQQLYCDDGFSLEINGEAIPLHSQILKTHRSLYSIGRSDRLILHVRRSLFQVSCPELERNTLHVQMLRDTPVVYGDEQRLKQEHLFTHQVFYHRLAPSARYGQDHVMLDLSGLLLLHQDLFMPKILNNLFVTTSCLREYHYEKQQINAFYHIQAINLPFQNFEFYWVQ